MNYLTSKDVSNFVRITDKDGTEVVVKTTNIDKVEPIVKQEPLTDVDIARLISGKELHSR